MIRDALVVGINTYNYERLPNLTTPAQDAEAIAQLLSDYGGFKVRRLPAVKKDNSIRVGQKTKVTLTQLEEALVQLFKPEGDNVPDTALFYFSGHGLRKNRGIQEGYLATSDVNPDLGFYGLSLQWLRRLLQECSIRQQIIWLDCCYSGELLNFTEANPGDRGKGRDRCFIAASREFEVAYQDVSSDYSVFTKALLQGLDPKRQPQGLVTNYTLIDFLKQDLKSVTQSFVFTNFGGEIILTGKAAESVNPALGGICPYKGLAYFDCNEEDPKYFYGREILTDQLLEKVRSGNLLAVLGASGSGKSSVMRAGLLHQLKLGQRLSGSDAWHTYIFRPGEHPLQRLAETFVESDLPTVDRATQLAKAEELIKVGAVGLGHLVSAVQAPRVVLVVDQFEEVFTLCQDSTERQQFFECLLGAVNRPDNKLCLVIVMRADFFGKCAEQEYAGLASFIQEHLVTVTPMTQQELEAAITEPAKKVGLEVERELVTQMIADVKESPGSLPLLQYTLTELWQQRTVERLTVSAYIRLGGVKGTLQKRADEVYQSLSPEEQQTAKRIFLELTHLGEGAEDTRRQVLKQELVTAKQSEELVDRVIQKLADAKLIVTSILNEKGSKSGRVAVVDVAHEALIRHWSLLRKWLDENQDKLRQKRKIEAEAEVWRDRGKPKDYPYLLQRKPLKEAVALQQEQTGNLMLSNLAQEFIDQSIRRIRQMRVAKRRLIGLGLATSFGLIIFLGFDFQKNQRIAQKLQVIELAKGQKENPTRIKALLQELVKDGGSLKNINLRRIDLSRAFLRGANLSNADLRGTNLSRADLRNTGLYNADLSNANLSNADLSAAGLGNANFSNTNLSSANLSPANLSDANLRGADLSDANLRSANLSDANLRGADLSDANLSDAILSRADLSSANLSNADLSGANLGCIAIPIESLIKFQDDQCTDFRGAKNLTPRQVKSAKDWDKARYDEEFRSKLGLK
ncbi:nSTAND1 domain-containing NTPase [Fischerella sp. PCC 9605]|uniref:nSTAND1 domain-containing NTPase n=1 Tax=Fischerella sp. PCC 9605 TaxID=1173024 RepID=UPI0004797E57|nr:pentapeptide repeat-containing protein [Fischerella sp. PCC 9605]